ncbi:MAG: lysylphosphatidylglycerol synthetase family protein [Bacteroidetes bacterium]|nr:lysylphosphatidylglycerol synthetase family protein [Bacteroidota bacterium]
MHVKSISSGINTRTILQITLALITLAFCFYFIKHEGFELQQSIQLISHAQWNWVLFGIVVSVFYLLVHAGMYVASFSSIQAKISLGSALILSLKRSFISVLLPAGGVSSLAFFTQAIERKGISRTKIHLASTIYGITAFGSLAIITIPAVIILAGTNELSTTIIYAVATLFGIIFLSIGAFRSFVKGKYLFKLASRFFPSLITFYEELMEQSYSKSGLLLTLLYSISIEICGILHLYIASRALGIDLTFKLALLGYVIATLLLAVSPFMRGLGAVELSLTYFLIQSGLPQIHAISVTLLYRLFEFWIPFIVSVFSFFYRKDHLIMRVLPSFFTLILGLVNIFSVLTPAITSRLEALKDFIPEQTINFSNFAVFIAGIILIILSTYMLRGLRNAWLLTLLIAFISMIGHLTKAIDYEEGLFSAAFILLLLYTRKNYSLKADKKLFRNASTYLISAFLFIIIYGMAGFYIMDKKHFGIDFSFEASFRYLVNALVLVNNDTLHPITRFANYFIHTLNFLGLGLAGTLLFLGIQPARYRRISRTEDREIALDLTQKHGSTSLDYFKTYHDKDLYITRNKESFVSFRKVGDYAVVLEGPVCSSPDAVKSVIEEFENYCAENGLKTLYYRVDASLLSLFKSLKKKSIFIGQEGIVDVQTFSLEGGEKKSTRNALNKLQLAGYTCRVAEPPVKDGLIQKLKAVSDEWIDSMGINETSFSQGVWNSAELKQQVIVYIEDPEEKVVAFANIIKDYAAEEGTYDLIRKTKDAPSKVLDALMVNLIQYFKEKEIKHLNLGLAPLSGMERGSNLPERTLKFAYDNFKQLDHFKGLRFFKEKYAYTWKDKYLVYSNDLDLLQAPVIINKVGRT